MDRDIFGEKTVNVQRPRTDRFVPPRAQVEMRRRHSLVREWGSPAEQYDFWDTKHARRAKYASYFNEVLGIELFKGTSNYNGNDAKDKVQLWPCRPRKKSCLTSADSVLDLPTYRYAAFPELLDWSKHDVLVAALGRKYHQYKWNKQALVGKGYTLSSVYSCKFDPRGELLALGTLTNVEVHDHQTTKRVLLNRCLCSKHCIITAVDWSPTGNSFVTGCSEGVIRAFSRQNEMISSYGCRRCIRTVKISPDARYVAAIGVAARCVLVFSWPSLEPYNVLDCEWVVKAINWHPWSSALLGVSTITSNLLSNPVLLYDAHPRRVQTVCTVPDNCTVDTLLFSPKSGEMVLGLWNEARTSMSDSGGRLVVLSNPNTIVDQWGENPSYLDRIRTMVFSPDGTKLATATTEEDLIIWNFLPEDKKKKNIYLSEKFAAIPVYLDRAMFGISIR